MKISFVQIQNFRKLKNCKINFGDQNTLFVGPNNSGKTSAMEALVKMFNKSGINFNDITVSNHKAINEIGRMIIEKQSNPDEIELKWDHLLPAIDIWIEVLNNEMQYVANLIPNLDWDGGLIGVRLLLQPDKSEKMYSDYIEKYSKARELENKASETGKNIKIWPINFCDYMKSKMNEIFKIKLYILDALKIDNEKDIPQEIDYEMETVFDSLQNIIKVDVIEAQRGFHDPDTNFKEIASRSLSAQLRNYYNNHLDPEKSPTEEDLNILQAMEKAKDAFDENLAEKFKDALDEVENMGYPGINNPKIIIESKIDAMEALKHESAIQYEVPHDNTIKEIYHLPEQYNGLGYQNLISMIFKLITFRDEWIKPSMRNKEDKIEPIHLVLIEEPEAHLHMQVQQVFIKEAYKVLTESEFLKDNTNFTTQLVITTHSSHIVKEIDFCDLRYFKRLPADKEHQIPTTIVIDLSKVFSTNNEEDPENQTRRFASRYLKTTHCDIFFADAIILVEGVAENMLLPHFIHSKYPKLNQMYISILEINGRHSHRLKKLIETIGIDTLIVTDLDTASSEGKHAAVEPKRNENQITTNYSITNWIMHEKQIDFLLDKDNESKVILADNEFNSSIRIAYQIPIEINYNDEKKEALTSTFEDSIIYSNLELFKNIDDKELYLNKISNIIKSATGFEDMHSKIYEEIRKTSFKKAEFALDLIYLIDPEKIVVPNYIDDGLNWLESQLSSKGLLEEGA
ncbi:MAG: AAA family ATPase [Clostridia bacterium]|jgi:predicted ATP-dependent endonuclease of OLD family